MIKDDGGEIVAAISFCKTQDLQYEWLLLVFLHAGSLVENPFELLLGQKNAIEC